MFTYQNQIQHIMKIHMLDLYFFCGDLWIIVGK